MTADIENKCLNEFKEPAPYKSISQSIEKQFEFLPCKSNPIKKPI